MTTAAERRDLARHAALCLWSDPEASARRNATQSKTARKSTKMRRQLAEVHAGNVGRKQLPETIERKRAASLAVWARRRASVIA